MLKKFIKLEKLIISFIRLLFHKILGCISLEVHRKNIGTNKSLQLYAALNFFKIDLIFDIGANTGQFSKEMRGAGYTGRIVSFEPLPDAYKKLKESAIHDKLWEVHNRCALGAEKCKTVINVSRNSVSSSILPMLKTHFLVEKESIYIGKVEADLITLDSVSKRYLSNSNNYFIKIDTQGFEWEILNGARKTLKNARGVLCELSLTRLYEGQKMWLDFIHRMDNEGFSLWEIHQEFLDPNNGRTLQINAIFFRE